MSLTTSKPFLKQSDRPSTRSARRIVVRTYALVLGLAMASSGPVFARDDDWLSREVPETINDILKDSTALQGLFSTRLETAPTPAALLRSVPAPLAPTSPRLPEIERLPDDSPLNDSLPELPAFPDTLLRQAPADLGRIAAPASERAGVPEPVFIREMWTFNTPVDRITPLTNALSANGRFVHDLPSALSRVDHLRAEGLPTEHWMESARLHRLPVEALYAVALQESGVRTAGGDVQPWPWTLNCNQPCPHGPMRFATRQAATDALEKLLKAGWRNIDIGAMQVNYRAHAKRFASYDLLDPRINVIIGGVILREAVQQAGGNLRNAYGLYHVGVLQADNASRAAHYSSSVNRWVSRLKAPGAMRVVRQ